MASSLSAEVELRLLRWSHRDKMDRNRRKFARTLQSNDNTLARSEWCKLQYKI